MHNFVSPSPDGIIFWRRKPSELQINCIKPLSNARNCKTAVDAGEKSLAAAREQAYQTEAELTESRKRLAEVRVEFERTRGLIDSQAKQAGGMEQRLQQGETEIGQNSERLKSLEQEREHLRASFAELQKAGVEAREPVAEQDGRARRIAEPASGA